MNEMGPHKISGTYIVPPPLRWSIYSGCGTGFFPQSLWFRERFKILHHSTLIKRLKKRLEVGHLGLVRSSRPARRNSSANLACSIAC